MNAVMVGREPGVSLRRAILKPMDTKELKDFKKKVEERKRREVLYLSENEQYLKAVFGFIMWTSATLVFGGWIVTTAVVMSEGAGEIMPSFQTGLGLILLMVMCGVGKALLAIVAILRATPPR